MPLNSGDESPMDDYYHASWSSALRHRSSLSRVIATVKITIWKSISSSYYSFEHCISPYENEQSVPHKLSHDSHSREHKTFCMKYKYVIEYLAPSAWHTNKL
jgi:hypothetical protein